MRKGVGRKIRSLIADGSGATPGERAAAAAALERLGKKRKADRPAPGPRPRLTDAIAQAARAPADTGQIIIYDGDGDARRQRAVRGFGLRVTRGGVKSWVLTYTTHGGRERRMTIGRFPDWNVEQARDKAGKLRRQVDDGKDPLQELQERRDAETVDELADQYLADHVAIHNRASSKRDAESLLDQWIRPELGKMKVADVTQSDVEALHRKISKGGRRTRANRALATLSKMMTLAVKWKLRADNPVRGVERNAEPKRNRYLDGDEMRRLTAALAKYPDQRAANALRLLLLTGARRSEVLLATWDQFDLKAKRWVKPGATTKQKTEHRVPLSAAAMNVLAAIRAADPKSPTLFPPETAAGIRDVWDDLREKAELGDARMHDLRHSYASMLASSGLSLPIIGALLGHTQPATTARYAHLFDDPLRAATETVGAIVVAAETGRRARAPRVERRR